MIVLSDSDYKNSTSLDGSDNEDGKFVNSYSAKLKTTFNNAKKMIGKKRNYNKSVWTKDELDRFDEGLLVCG